MKCHLVSSLRLLSSCFLITYYLAQGRMCPPKGQGRKTLRLCFLMSFSHSVMSDSLRPMDRNTPGLLVHHQLPELAQTHVHQVSNAIQPSHPLSSPYPPALNLSQNQDLLHNFSSSHQMAKVLELQFQHQCFQ